MSTPTPPPDPLDAALAGLKAAIKTLAPKSQQMVIDWLIRWGNLIVREKKFDPQYVPYFKRGDIVYVDLGFNVGSEHGGVHYAAIYEYSNNKKNKNVVVVPLSSVYDETKISHADLYLGDDIIPWTPGVKTIAKPNQIRSISKMRILKPLSAGDSKAKLKAEHLDKIDAKLKELLFKPEPTTE